MKGAIAWFGLRPFPISLAYEMSWLCNLECGYCDRHTPMERELNREQIFAALGEFAALGLRDVSLDGGEPLAHRNVDEVVQWLVERGIEVTMHTNAILLPRKIATVRKLTKVKISLDGPAEQHDAMRGKGSFASAIAGARAARDAGIKVEFTCVITRHNADSVEALLEIAEQSTARSSFSPDATACSSAARATAQRGSSNTRTAWRYSPASRRSSMPAARWVTDGRVCVTFAAFHTTSSRRAPPVGSIARWIPRACCFTAANATAAIAATT